MLTSIYKVGNPSEIYNISVRTWLDYKSQRKKIFYFFKMKLYMQYSLHFILYTFILLLLPCLCFLHYFAFIGAWKYIIYLEKKHTPLCE